MKRPPPRLSWRSPGGLTDLAGERGETDALDLERRITCAIFGYLAGISRIAKRS
jgi:hypothetical protein